MGWVRFVRDVILLLEAIVSFENMRELSPKNVFFVTMVFGDFDIITVLWVDK